jgi:predicted  nucleic acid-binding Zn-ribbon protein
MGQIEDKTQVINPSPTQADLNRDRRIAARVDRLNQASIAEARRRVAQLETTIANFERTIRELDGWIKAEQSRPGVHADSTLASSLIQRRDTLKRSIEELERKLAETRAYA